MSERPNTPPTKSGRRRSSPNSGVSIAAPALNGWFVKLFEDKHPAKSDVSQVLVYHDASDDPFTAHACLVIPVEARKVLLTELRNARGRWRCQTKLHFVEFSGKNWGAEERCAEEWICLGVEALRRKGSRQFHPPLKCKLGIMFFDRRARVELDRFGGDKKEQFVRWTETLIRIALKGALHYCYSTEEPVHVIGMCTDGRPYKRDLSGNRILERLRDGVRPYVGISASTWVSAVQSDHRKSECKDPESAQLLQLTDLLLGAACSCVRRDHAHGSKKERLSRPVREMLDKRRRGKFFERSGHYRSFSLSYATIEQGRFVFRQLASQLPKAQVEQLGLWETS